MKTPRLVKDDDMSRIALLEYSIEHLNQTLTRIDKRFDSMETQLNNRFNILDTHIKSNFEWTLGLTLGGIGGLFGLLAHAVHWI